MAEPQTIIVPGDGSSTLAYELPAGVLQYVQSVVAVVDTSASGDVQPVLSIATAAGTPIADKQQGRAIAGGGQGRATWAHRLDDESTSSPPTPASSVVYDYTLAAPQPSIDTLVDGPMAGLLPQTFTTLHFVAVTRTDDAGVGVGDNVSFRVNNDVTPGHYAYMIQEWQNSGIGMTGGPVQANLWTVRSFGASGTANYFASAEGTLPGYAGATSRFRNVQILAGDIDPAGVAGDGFIDTLVGVWKSSASITRLAVASGNAFINLVAGSRLTVFGW